MLLPLNAQGAADKLALLYNLPDHDLQVEARKISADFMSWLSFNFQITAAQRAFLSSAPSYVQAAAGSACALQFHNRGTITLDYLDPEPPEPSGYIKYWETETKAKVVVDSSGHISISSELIFRIYWKVKAM